MEKGGALDLNKLESTSPKNGFPSLVEIGSVVLEQKIFNLLQYIFTLLLLSPLGKGGALPLNKVEFPSYKNALCQVW